jgi:hypothetical protein
MVMHAFCSVGSFVVLGEPLQVLVFDPGHPVSVLVLVALLNPFGIGKAFLLLGGHIVKGGLLLVLRHSVPFLCAFVVLVAHGCVDIYVLKVVFNLSVFMLLSALDELYFHKGSKIHVQDMCKVSVAK